MAVLRQALVVQNDLPHMVFADHQLPKRASLRWLDCVTLKINSLIPDYPA
jgi:hypothetical protein